MEETEAARAKIAAELSALQATLAKELQASHVECGFGNISVSMFAKFGDLKKCYLLRIPLKGFCFR